MNSTEFIAIAKKHPLVNFLFDYNEIDKSEFDSFKKVIIQGEEDTIFNDINWIYGGYAYVRYIIGLLNDKVMAINEDCQIIVYCNHIQDIPFESYRRIFDVLDYEREEHLKKLKDYEQWLKDNNIPIDPDRIYHDAQGNILNMIMSNLRKIFI